ncbi:MAG TPA: DUF4286 family protein [Gemmatimonadales bacterium]|nr:DUF4286 family protein [Gemmatimonadales bacterium]
MTSGEGSVSYEVTLEVEPELLSAVLRELREHHIPEILKTGCFTAIRLDRIDKGRLRTRYEAARAADLDRYLKEHTAHFRADFMARFPRGVRPTREVWQAVAEWRRDPA